MCIKIKSKSENMTLDNIELLVLNKFIAVQNFRLFPPWHMHAYIYKTTVNELENIGYLCKIVWKNQNKKENWLIIG